MSVTEPTYKILVELKPKKVKKEFFIFYLPDSHPSIFDSKESFDKLIDTLNLYNRKNWWVEVRKVYL